MYTHPFLQWPLIIGGAQVKNQDLVVFFELLGFLFLGRLTGVCAWGFHLGVSIEDSCTGDITIPPPPKSLEGSGCPLPKRIKIRKAPFNQNTLQPGKVLCLFSCLLAWSQKFLGLLYLFPLCFSTQKGPDQILPSSLMPPVESSCPSGTNSLPHRVPGEDSVISSQSCICVPKRTQRVSRRTQWVLSFETVLLRQYSAHCLLMPWSLMLLPWGWPRPICQTFLWRPVGTPTTKTIRGMGVIRKVRSLCLSSGIILLMFVCKILQNVHNRIPDRYLQTSQANNRKGPGSCYSPSAAFMGPWVPLTGPLVLLQGSFSSFNCRSLLPGFIALVLVHPYQRP